MAKRRRKGCQVRTKEDPTSKSPNLKQTQFKWVGLKIFRIGYNPINHAYEQSNRG